VGETSLGLRCFDSEPGRIRTTISRRDNVSNDDWVGVSLDSSRAGQIAYHLFVNPSGIQMDALQSSNEDTAVDPCAMENRDSWPERHTIVNGESLLTRLTRSVTHVIASSERRIR
jgi:hypothetical protein